jgi:hypothetical protein
MTSSLTGSSFHFPKNSDWTCHFSDWRWTPQEGKVPNAWVRFWMKVFFGCEWVKKG